MNRIIFIGRSGCGKTTLTQALRNQNVRYEKTQSVKLSDFIIDTPGEYIESRNFGGALAVYTYESDIVGLLLSADEPYSLYSPNIVTIANRPVIGIVTKTDIENADPDRAARWLKLAGCKKIFFVSFKDRDSINKLRDFLAEYKH